MDSYPQLPKPGELITDKYRVERALRTSSSGAVFEVVHEVTGKKFALKWQPLTASEPPSQPGLSTQQVGAIVTASTGLIA